MSKGRLYDLQMALKDSGWEISNPKDMFSIEDEHIVWHLVKNDYCVDAEFYIVGLMGERSYDLNDLCHCVIRGHEIELTFPKRNTDRWHGKVKDFVEALNQLSPGGNPSEEKVSGTNGT